MAPADDDDGCAELVPFGRICGTGAGKRKSDDVGSGLAGLRLDGPWRVRQKGKATTGGHRPVVISRKGLFESRSGWHAGVA